MRDNDDRLIYDYDDEEYEQLTEEEQTEAWERTAEDALDMMFPDGMDDE